MDFIIPRELNLLGFSGSILALVLETLKARQYSGKIRIIKNVPVEEQITYNPGFSIEEYSIEELEHLPDEGLLFATFKPSVKQAIFLDFENKIGISKSQFTNLAHPHAHIASTCTFATGIYIEPGVVISPFAKIGFGVSVNRGATIGHHTEVQEFASINPGVHIAGHCTIGHGTSIGMGSVVFDHIQIGPNTLIGGGSVVNKDIPAGVLAYGNPCKVIRKL